MPLKIEPHAIEQEKGYFTFPGVRALAGTNEFTFNAAGGEYGFTTGSALISARDTFSLLYGAVTIHGSVLHLMANDGRPAIRIEDAGGFGAIKLNPTAADFDLTYLADDGTPLLYGDGGNGHMLVGGDEMLGGMSGKLGVIDGNLIIAINTGSTTSAGFTMSQENAWITGSTGLGRYTFGVRNSGELALYNWGWQASKDVLRAKAGRTSIGSSVDPVAPYALSVIDKDTTGFHANVDKYTGLLVGQTGSAESLAIDAIDYGAFGGFHLGLISLNARFDPTADTWTRIDESMPALNLDMQASKSTAIGEYLFKTWTTGTSAWLPQVQIQPRRTLISDQYDFWDDFTPLTVRSQQDYSDVGGYGAFAAFRVATSGSSPGMAAIQIGKFSEAIWFGSFNTNVGFDAQSGTWSRVNQEYGGVIFQNEHRSTHTRNALWIYDMDDTFTQFHEYHLASGTSGQHTITFNPLSEDIDFRVYADTTFPIFARGSDGYVGIGGPQNLGARLTVNAVVQYESQLRLNASGTFTTFSGFDGGAGGREGFMDIDPQPQNSGDATWVRLFRSSDGSLANFVTYKGDNTNTPMHWLGGYDVIFNVSKHDIDFEVYATGSANPDLFVHGEDGFVGLGTATPARRLHVYGVTGTYSRIEVPGIGLAAQREYLRGSSYTWLGPTAGNEFHLWSQEDIPFVLGLDNTEVMRWHGDGYGQLSGVTANPTGTAVPSTDIRWWAIDASVTDDVILMMNDNEDRMVGTPHGYYAVANTAATSIAASPTYTKMPWWWLFRGVLHRTPIGMITHDSSSGDTDVIIRDSGIFEIWVDVTIEVTSGTSRSSCHGYIDKNGSKLTGTDFYTYNRDATNGFDTGSTFWLGRLIAGDVISVKASRVAGTDTCVTVAGGTRLYIKQVGFSN